MGGVMKLVALSTILIGVVLLAIGIAGNSAWPYVDVIWSNHFAPAVGCGLMGVLSGVYMYLAARPRATDSHCAIALVLAAVNLAFHCNLVVHSANKVKYWEAPVLHAATIKENAEGSMLIVMLVISSLNFVLTFLTLFYLSVQTYGAPFADSYPPEYDPRDMYPTRRPVGGTMPRMARSDHIDYRIPAYKMRY